MGWSEWLTRLVGGGGGGEPAAAPPAARRRAVEIGWLLDTGQARFIWGEPRRVRTTEPTPQHAKSVSNCPAFLDHEARMFEVPCPIDARLGLRFGEGGAPSLVNLDGDASGVRNKHLGKMVVIVSQKEWRNPKRPIVQFITPYVFLADEPVWMTQLPPIGSFAANAWPGVLIGGRLPIHLWPRQMMWAFEWWDVTRPLELKRGQPWFNVAFETTDPARPLRLVEAEMTPALREYSQGLSGVTNYVNRTFSLFKVAEERRPERLLTPKPRPAAPAPAPAED